MPTNVAATSCHALSALFIHSGLASSGNKFGGNEKGCVRLKSGGDGGENEKLMIFLNVNRQVKMVSFIASFTGHVSVSDVDDFKVQVVIEVIEYYNRLSNHDIGIDVATSIWRFW